MKNVFKIAVILGLVINSGCDSFKNQDKNQTNVKIQTLKKESIDKFKPVHNSTSLFKKISKSKNITFDKFLKSIVVENQFFKLHSGVNEVIGKNGVKIQIPENAFTDSLGNIVLNENVIFKLKEFVSDKDIIFNNLTTKSDDKLLETGGMLYLEAESNGKNIKLTKGKNLNLKFPVQDTLKHGMEIFYGESKGSSKEINWKLSTNRVKHTKKISNKFIDKYSSSNYYYRDYKYFDKRKYDKIKNRPKVLGSKTEFLSQIAYPTDFINNKIEGNVNADIFLEENGDISFVNVKEHFTKSADSMVENAIKKYRKWIPNVEGSQLKNGKVNVKVVFRINKFGSKYINVLSMPFVSNELKFNRLKDSLFKKCDERSKEINYVKFYNEYQGRLLTNEDYLKFKKDSIAFLTNSNDKIQVENVINSAYYVLSSSNLGWINCDRFVDKSLNELIIKGESPKIIFTKMRSILSPSGSWGADAFFQIPLGEPFIVVDFIKLKNGNLGVYYKKFNQLIDKKIEIDEYRELSSIELNRLIKNIRS